MAKAKKKPKKAPKFDGSLVTQKGRVGCPPRIQDPEELKGLINQYFDYCTENNIVYTISGLANSIGITRRTLLNYQYNGDNPNATEDQKAMANVLNQAKSIIEQDYEESLRGAKPVGSIFALKNSFEGWNADNEMTIKEEVTITQVLDSLDVPDDVIDVEFRERVGDERMAKVKAIEKSKDTTSFEEMLSN